MYIIAIAWLYVTVLMAATEKTVVSGILTFIFYGLLPCALLLWILGIKHRRHKRATKENISHLIDDTMHEPDSTNTQRDE